MKQLLALIALCIALASPASAHSLRVFATVEGPEVTGYGFFVGGGRPKHVDWIATMSGAEITRGKTDADGGFSFTAPETVSGPVRVTINSGEGHIASRDLSPERFGSRIAQSGPAPATTMPAQQHAAPLQTTEVALTEAMIETAVARQVAPLLERIEQMDSRMRLTDVISGLCLIIGIAGIALWARGHRG